MAGILLPGPSMRANEFGVKGPKANTTKVMMLRLVERIRRVLAASGGSGELIIDANPVIQAARDEMVILERMALDYGPDITGGPVDSVNEYGISKLAENILAANIDITELTNLATWFGITIVCSDGTGAVKTSDHSEEDVFSVISRSRLQSQYNGWYLWLRKGIAAAVTLRIFGRFEYTKIWTQRTYSEEYTRLGTKYGHGWEDCEWEESLQPYGDDDEE